MAAGIALGSSGAVILICTVFIGMLVLSLIPIYSPNNSATGFGEGKSNFLSKIKQSICFFVL